MPETPTNYMLLVLPTPGSDTDLWDDLVNAALGGTNGVDAHDHTPGRGKPVPTDGIDIDADLPLNGFRLETVTGLEFVALGANLAVGAREVFVGPDNNLYYRNAAGQNVRITNGSTLDVTSVGGIAGDYAAIGAEVAYVDATDTYTMRQQLSAAVRQFARVACAGVDLYEYLPAGSSPVPASRVRLSSPAALAGSYAITFPGALPVAQSIVQVTSAGQLVFSNTASNVVLGTVAADAITLNANQSVTVSGTGQFKHGSKTRKVAVQPVGNPAGGIQVVVVTSVGASFTLPLEVGERILRLRAVIKDAVGGANAVRISLASAVAGSAEVLTGGGTASNGSNTLQTIQSTVLTTSVVSGTVYRATLTYAVGGASFEIYDIEVDYDRP